MCKIVIIGSSCAGKTTLARKISEKLEIKYIELDSLYWLENWTERPKDEFYNLVQQAVSDNRCWVIDGNYAMTRGIIWPQATMVIWLNYSFGRVLYQAIFRTIRRVFTRQKVCNGNVESFRHAFLSKDSVIWWVITTYHKKRASYHTILAQNGDNTVSWPKSVQLSIFTTPKQAAAFLQKLEVNKVS